MAAKKTKPKPVEITKPIRPSTAKQGQILKKYAQNKLSGYASDPTEQPPSGMPLATWAKLKAAGVHGPGSGHPRSVPSALVGRNLPAENLIAVARVRENRAQGHLFQGAKRDVKESGVYPVSSLPKHTHAEDTPIDNFLQREHQTIRGRFAPPELKHRSYTSPEFRGARADLSTWRTADIDDRYRKQKDAVFSLIGGLKDYDRGARDLKKQDGQWLKREIESVKKNDLIQGDPEARAKTLFHESGMADDWNRMQKWKTGDRQLHQINVQAIHSPHTGEVEIHMHAPTTKRKVIYTITKHETDPTKPAKMSAEFLEGDKVVHTIDDTPASKMDHEGTSAARFLHGHSDKHEPIASWKAIDELKK